MSKFVLVKVVGGRKFQGFAYDFGAEVSVSEKWGTKSIKLWSPETGFVYCNPKYISPAPEADEETDKANHAKFEESAIGGVVAWCRTKSIGKDEEQILAFARSVLAKRSPDLVPAFDAKFPSIASSARAEKTTEDEIRSTFKWASGLRTRSGYFHGHYCHGGNPYPAERVLAIATRALETRGISTRPDYALSFEAVRKELGF